ncbi:MAG: hypothetical protein CMJ58_23515 [Planctomycetaceae bacterium]|nr:hypothetical protein [Planctomycetaceae bacterium]
MNESACQQRFAKAIGILVDDPGRVKDRLLTAYGSQLSAIDPRRDLPEALVTQYDEIRYALSDADMPYGYGERAAKKLHDMSEDEAGQLARRLFALFLQLQKGAAVEA